MPDPAPQPVYAFRCFLASGFAGAFSVTCFALMFSLPDQWIRVAAVIGAMCAVMGVATTAVCLKLDTARREQFDLHNDLAVVGYRLTQLDRLVREAVDEQTSDLSAAVAELQATRTQMADFMKLYKPGDGEPPPWAEELRRDLDAIGRPSSVLDMEPMVHLHRIERRLQRREDD